MALPSTVHRASIQLADTDRSCYGALQATIARHPSETAERLVARLLAYALCHEEGLAFSKGIGAGDEPDLWLREPDGRVRLWIEVGLPDPARLVKAARQADRVILFASGNGRRRWEETHLGSLAALRNLTVYGLDWPFLQQLAARLERTIDWSLTVSGGMLYLSVDGHLLEAPLPILLEPGKA